ncbi:MAG: thiamine pyrophosphate-dependent enzyme [Schleiferiaceae bacterium]|jgi:2-oxoisovalerate dehydrogenase E1 component|nr:thiamine pyrophosphate-dependent enzyme [Schleiferiaceae bacterium]
MGKQSPDILLKAFSLMATAKAMTELYEKRKAVTQTYVHATSRGHEAIQLAMGLQLKPCDYAYPYYRDDAMLLGMGLSPYDLMLQLLAKKDDPFSGGRTYYCHPSLKDDDKPKIPHQSSATGMQAIPASGAAMGIQYREQQGLTDGWGDDKPVVMCSIGDAAMTEGEVSEALQMAALKQYPLLMLVQDNEWDISARADEIRSGNAAEYAKGFKGIKVVQVDGSDFAACYHAVREVLKSMREGRQPHLIHATVPLLNHHTSGVRMEWYRDDLDEAAKRDPFPKLHDFLVEQGVDANQLKGLVKKANALVASDFERAMAAEDPSAEDLFTHCYAESPITEERGERAPADRESTVMVDCALFAIREIMEEHPEALLYGQDVGHRLGGVFREAATLAQTFGDDRAFNTPIQEAFIIGSTVGMAAVGLKPIVEIQFADYIWPGLNQLFSELSRSNYLSNGKWPASAVIRVPIGAYGSGGPYHSSSVESVLSNIRGIKVAYPSNGADLKGLMKSAFYDPNPVVMLEHKGLYWSKIPGTDSAKTIEPDADYAIPFGKGRIVQAAKPEAGESLCVITYGRGVHWALEASQQVNGGVEIVDLRTIVPIDEALIAERSAAHGRVMVITEEPVANSFAQSLAGRIQAACFDSLDAPVTVIGSESTPAIPLNSTLEAALLPSADKVAKAMQALLAY